MRLTPLPSRPPRAGGEPVAVCLPRPPPGAVWRLLVDTGRPVPTAAAAAPGGGAASLGAVLPPNEQSYYTLGEPHRRCVSLQASLGITG
jgi:hypothetical protein